jgi:hypothetical protein
MIKTLLILMHLKGAVEGVGQERGERERLHLAQTRRNLDLARHVL